MSDPRIPDVTRRIQSGDCQWLKDNFPKLNCDCSTGICTADTPDGSDQALNKARKDHPEFIKIQLPTKEIWFQSRLRIDNQWWNVLIVDGNDIGNPYEDTDNILIGRAGEASLQLLRHFMYRNTTEIFIKFVAPAVMAYESALRAAGILRGD
ncbi:MAG: hypothetical protein JXA24_04740 [Proteobacteria bacterium]|nr:hypothetical protein [Pseudomonadota bacterium]